ncbi:MAG: alpha/beta hydrolase [Oscillospiraceae bacterium]|nr:alpha/beta hydrolase [Oscillospiraceae bacterium]
MDKRYNELKAGMKELAVLQNRLFWEVDLHGTRHVLPLEGRDLAVVFYPGKPEDPVVFGCYGGGFIMGSAANDDACWAELRETLGVNLFSINYRKAPEHPFPEPLYDVYDSIAFLEAHLGDFEIRSLDYSVLGFSAGGNLAAAVCLLDAKRGGKLDIRRQILNYPYLDLVTSPKAKGHPESERMIYTLFPEYYCASQNPADSLISPVYAVEEILKKLPRAIVCLGERDPLHAEGARYVAKLRAAGIEVACMVTEDMPHGYLEVAFQQPAPISHRRTPHSCWMGASERLKMRALLL